jgi:hypothetical protein
MEIVLFQGQVILKMFYEKQQSARRRTVKEPWGVFLATSCVLVSVWQYPHGCWQLYKKVKLQLQGGASRSLIIFFRYMPLDPADKAGLARHETGHASIFLKNT